MINPADDMEIFYGDFGQDIPVVAKAAIPMIRDAELDLPDSDSRAWRTPSTSDIARGDTVTIVGQRWSVLSAVHHGDHGEEILVALVKARS